LAAWSIGHPVGVSTLAVAIVVLGLFALGRLAIDLHPHLIYPEVRVRVIQPGVPAKVMEDQVTRQLEEQLAITEDAVSVQSRTVEGNSSVDLSFEYGKDIDLALRDASTRLDRAKRFLPATIDPPTIYKRDPSQIPVLEFVVASPLKDPVVLRSWVDDVFRKWFLNLPGVAAVEVGGGLVREIQVRPDQQRLNGVGLRMQDVIDALQRGNREDPTGRLRMSRQEITGRVLGRFTSVNQIAELPLVLPDRTTLPLGEFAEVLDTHEDERLRVRVNGIPGIKVSVQKQPAANTVAVVDVVKERLQWLEDQKLMPEDVTVYGVADQSVYIRQALNNSTMAAVSGAILAMIVVYLFLGNVRRTLIIGSAIPIAIMVTFVLMGWGGLTLNIMTLGGLALGIGMLVDNTIVMMENIYRHQQEGRADESAAAHAAAEVNSAIMASTSTNLAAVLPFLFIGGLVGLLFRELIFTISAAILASMVIALTLVPALAAKVQTRSTSAVRRLVDGLMLRLQRGYARLLELILSSVVASGGLTLVFCLGIVVAMYAVFGTSKQIFLPKMDDGQIRATVVADPGITLEEMDRIVLDLEEILRRQPEVESVFSIVGGFIFGRTQREVSNQSTLTIQLVPVSQRNISSDAWIKRVNTLVRDADMAGVDVRMRTVGIRGIRTSRGDDDVSIRVRGPSLEVLEDIAESMVLQLREVKGLRNVVHSSEEKQQEIAFEIDRERAAVLGLEVEDLSNALAVALEGKVVTDFIDGDRTYDVRLRLPRIQASNPQDLASVLLYPASENRQAIYLGNVATIKVVDSPARILRDNQQRIVEITASVNDDETTLGAALDAVEQKLAGFELPEGYDVYDGGAREELQKNRRLTTTLLLLALFLVFVVLAVQYESLVNPFVILFSVPFASIGVALGIFFTGLPLSTPAWLGMIMLAGIVVNNAIVLVEYIEIVRETGLDIRAAIVEAGRLRLRPILMTTLTTVVGMIPLAVGVGDGAEMLQPLAVTIVSGLAFSTLVSLFLVPILYRAVHGRLVRSRIPVSAGRERPGTV